MEKKTELMPNDPLPPMDLSGGDHCWKVKVKCEAGFEDQQHDVTGWKEESMVKEEVQVKMEGEDEGSLTGGSEASMENVGFSRHVKDEQSREGVDACQQQLAEDGSSDSEGFIMIKVEGGGTSDSDEDEEGDAEWEGVMQPQVHFEDCKVEPDSCQETDMENQGRGEEQGGEAGVHLQARAEASVATGGRVSGAQWSEGSPAPVASSSLAVSGPRPCVSREESAQLCPLKKRRCSSPRQQQCRKKARVQSAGGVVPTQTRDTPSLHSSIRLVAEGLKMFLCPHCDYESVRKGTLQRHVETVHEGLRKYPCPLCQYKASEKSYLQKHIDTVHEGIRKYSCPHCPYKAGRKNYLQSHIEAVHEGLRKYPCPHCPYRAGQKRNLQTHIDTVHEGLRKYPCPHCQYRAGEKRNLLTHIETVHEGQRKFPCPHCQHRAGRKGDLQTHIDTVHDGLRNFPCPHCQYKAGRKAHLQTHIDTVHEGLRKFPCPHCPYRAGEKGNLHTHIETVHEGLRKFPCPQCQYRAGHKCSLQKHMKTVHKC